MLKIAEPVRFFVIFELLNGKQYIKHLIGKTIRLLHSLRVNTLNITKVLIRRENFNIFSEKFFVLKFEHPIIFFYILASLNQSFTKNQKQ